MTYVYQNIRIGDNLYIGNNAQVSVGTVDSHVVTTQKGDILTDNGNYSIALPVGVDGQALVANSATSTGLEWSDVSLTTLDIQDTATVAVSSPTTLVVNSNATSGQPLLSSGTVGTEAKYGALDLSSVNAVTGVLKLANGGTNNNGPYNPNDIVIVNATGDALVSSNININNIAPIAGTVTSTDDTPTAIYTYLTTSGKSYYIQASYVARNTADGTTASFKAGTTWTNIAGTLTLVDKAVDLSYVPFTTPWTVSFTTTGNNINFLVTGSAATNIDWATNIQIVSV